MVVWVPPHGLIDINILNKEGHQQVDEKEELKQKVPVYRQLRDSAVSHRLRGDQGCNWRSREADSTTIPEKERNNTSLTLASVPGISYPIVG